MNKRRIAITGIGVVSVYGVGSEVFGRGIATGVPDNDPGVSRRPVDLAAVASTLNDPRLERRIDPGTMLALVAAEEALAMSGGPDVPPEKRSAFFGSTLIGLDTLLRDVPLVVDHHGQGLSVHNQPRLIANAAPAHFAIRNGFRGPVQYISNACASSNTAVALAALQLRAGLCDYAVAGGWEGTGRDIVYAGLDKMGVMSPTGVARPFDREHDGVVVGEGSGMLVLEDWNSALKRGADIWGELLGVASNCDAFHISSPDPLGTFQAQCMHAAMRDAQISPSELVCISAHGNATPYNDDAEAQAIRKSFGTHSPPIWSFKGATGHTWAAAGGMGTIGLLLSARRGTLSKTWGCSVPSDAAQGLDIVLENRPLGSGPMMSNAFGFGGHNACVVFRPVI